jgi:hypothetical protein
VTVDGMAQALVDGAAVLSLTGRGAHRVVLRLGPRAEGPVSSG